MSAERSKKQLLSSIHAFGGDIQMVFMPFDLVLRWLAGLLSIALLGGGIYILHEWYQGDLIGRAWLLRAG